MKVIHFHQIKMNGFLDCFLTYLKCWKFRILCKRVDKIILKKNFPGKNWQCAKSGMQVKERWLMNDCTKLKLNVDKMTEFCLFEGENCHFSYVFLLFHLCPISAVQEVFLGHFHVLAKHWLKNTYRTIRT